MKVEYLNKMDRIARKAGTREPDDVLDAMGCVFMDPGGSAVPDDRTPVQKQE